MCKLIKCCKKCTASFKRNLSLILNNKFPFFRLCLPLLGFKGGGDGLNKVCFFREEQL